MTERLYLADPYLVRFEAQVVRQTRLGERAALVLDRTAFYPEGGGQPADRGTLGGVAVMDVQERDGEVLHALAGPPPSGRVEGLVDWARRFDHMQQHHGQHLLSAAFERLHRAHTVSFHLGEGTCSIDLDVPAARLDEKALRAAEAAANEAVWRDLPVTARDFSPEELARLPLRKEPMKGSRVVVVGDLDASPCGGTHPRRTGEVGAVAVLGARKWGEGARVEFVCGARVVRGLAEAGGRLAAAAQALRCAPAEVPEASARVAEESLGRRKEVERLVAALAGEAGERLAAGGAGPVVARLEPPLSGAAGLRAAAAALAARGRVALLGGVEDGRAFLCFARPRGPGPHLGDLVRDAAAALGGKGGGAPDLAQGSGPDAARLAEALDLARGKLPAPEKPAAPAGATRR
ncbi:MAG TPA: alanyl-tRNA editing protein [Anaeromyxobacteraceae bacterium]